MNSLLPDSVFFIASWPKVQLIHVRCDRVMLEIDRYSFFSKEYSSFRFSRRRRLENIYGYVLARS